MVHPLILFVEFPVALPTHRNQIIRIVFLRFGAMASEFNVMNVNCFRTANLAQDSIINPVAVFFHVRGFVLWHHLLNLPFVPSHRGLLCCLIHTSVITVETT
jgi:hypothetical protein